MSPLEFMQRLAALVPRPRLHLIRFHGVPAPHAKMRAAIVPIPAQTTTGQAGDCEHARGASVTHELGAVVEASVRHRYRTLPTVRR